MNELIWIIPLSVMVLLFMGIVGLTVMGLLTGNVDMLERIVKIVNKK